MLAHQSRSSPALCAGDPNSQWKAFEEQKAAHVNVNLRLSAGVLPEWDTPSASGDAVVAATWENLGPSKIVRDQRIGVASDFWNRYEEDIQLAKDVRACPPSLPPDQTPRLCCCTLRSRASCADCNSFRLSIEWSRLFPRRGELNQAAVERYNAIFDTLERCAPPHWWLVLEQAQAHRAALRAPFAAPQMLQGHWLVPRQVHWRALLRSWSLQRA